MFFEICLNDLERGIFMLEKSVCFVNFLFMYILKWYESKS